ncbi:hypothetical protein D3C78_1197540 [compost metagenome]
MDYEIGYISDVLATYRVLPKSASHSSDWRHKVLFERGAYKVSFYFNNIMGGVVAKKEIRTGYCCSLFNFFLSSGRFCKAFDFFECSCSFLILVFAGIRRRVFGFLKSLAVKKI